MGSKAGGGVKSNQGAPGLGSWSLSWKLEPELGPETLGAHTSNIPEMWAIKQKTGDLCE